MTVTEQAYAKINLFLDVLGRRDDGFHEIYSIMHSVSLSDNLIVTAELSTETNITIETETDELRKDKSNLVYQAVEKYLSYYNIHAKVAVRLEKHIPIGAGLGGGSSDAAATLRALNKIFNLATESELVKISSEIGSDVPFCIAGGLAECTGRGEIIKPLLDIDKMNFVIAIGSQRVSTPKAFAVLDEKYHNFDLSLYSPAEYSGKPYNIFESVIINYEIIEIKEIMKKNGAEYTLMSGSGPSVFGVYADMDSAERAKQKLIENGFSAFTANSVQRIKI